MCAEQSFRLGYSTITWGPTPDLDRVFGTIADAGWEGVEFISVALDWLGTPKRLRGLLDAHQLPPVCLFGSVSLGDDAEQVLERQRRIIEYASELGAPHYCFLGGNRVALRLPDDDEFKRLAEQAEILIDYAEPLGVAVSYHAHPRCTVESEEEQDKLLAYTERLEICMDVSVAAFMQEDAVAQIRKYADRIGYAHMKDWTNGKFCPMGKGTAGLDFTAIREAFAEIGYTGWIMGEMSSYADFDAEESCKYNLEYLRSLGY